MSKQNDQRLYNISRLKQIVMILTVALCVFAGITALLISANIYKCEGTIYERTVNPQDKELPLFKQWNNIDAKITYLDFAFGLEHSDESYEFVPVSQDSRFLFLYLAQIAAYALLLFQLFKSGKTKSIMTIVTALALIAVGIYSFIFFHNYSNELQNIFDESIKTIAKVYKNPNDANASISLTGDGEGNYISKINVTMSVVPFLSCAYMVISGFMCVAIEYMRYIIDKTSNRGAKWMSKRN